MKTKMKSNVKLILGIIIGIIISTSSVFAATIIKSSDVTYDNGKSGGSSQNVQGSLDELYKKAKTLSGELDHNYKDPILNGADPELKDPLIPVTIDPSGKVTYAKLNTEWYNYSEKKWANAVILVGKPNKNYNPGDVIDESDIESYFVWIPRYRYKIWNLGNYTTVQSVSGLLDDGLTNDGEGGNKLSVRKLFGNARLIDIVFESKATPKSQNEAVGKYLTHPAFTLGTTELNGFWIGKFETGYNQNSDTEVPITTANINSWTTANAQKNVTAAANVIVKPNVYSWRYSSVKNMFYTSYNYQRGLESHMLKNTEWGAVAYLSHSAYGIGNEININNNNAYKTGYSAAADTDQSTYPGTSGNTDNITKQYNTSTGYLASTTGNITGVYDMSGGAWEYMAAGILNNIGKSELTVQETNTYSKYFDLYNINSSVTSYNWRKLGDATGEMGPFFGYKDGDGSYRYHNTWYADDSGFVDSSYPWFGRGGAHNDGVLAGQFGFHRDTGEPSGNVGFRLALAI